MPNILGKYNSKYNMPKLLGIIYIFVLNMTENKKARNESDQKEKLQIIGERLKTMRKGIAKVGYIEFSEKVDLTRNTYNNMENGRFEYNIGNLIKVLAFYEITLEQFFKDVGL
ncbi:helix-turn-helix domain-containing protein [Labilibacter marinus]|uniref:helix-turn-helix domain-containing protein n=1 Tax=Labilibacter marinus TaxID=1477105 RepID=UPI0008360CC8|nr:helix-turn-helix transcriptional regulator [Labilibacter marinus]